MLINRTRQRSRKQPNYFQAEPAAYPKKPSSHKKIKRNHKSVSQTDETAPIHKKKNSKKNDTKKKKRTENIDNAAKKVCSKKNSSVGSKRTRNEEKHASLELPKSKTSRKDEKDLRSLKGQSKIESKFSDSISKDESFKSLLYLEDNISIEQAFPTSKLVLEDIQCGTGLAFKHWDSAEDEENEKWLDKYTDRSGVRKWIPRDRKNFYNSQTHSWRNARYRSRFWCDGLNLNLGNHHSSASAAAAIDLANILCWGSEDCKPLNVLSTIEASVGLRASGVRGIFSGGRVEPLRVKFFTESVKNSFLKNIDGALASIGGQDDLLSSIICSLDAETARNAMTSDKTEELERERELKLKKRAKAARERRNRLKESERDTSNTAAMNDMLEKDSNVFNFQNEYGIFEVDNHGQLCWVLENEFDIDDVLAIQTDETNTVNPINCCNSAASMKDNPKMNKSDALSNDHLSKKKIENDLEKPDCIIDDDASMKQDIKSQSDFHCDKQLAIKNSDETSSTCLITKLPLFSQ